MDFGHYLAQGRFTVTIWGRGTEVPQWGPGQSSWWEFGPLCWRSPKSWALGKLV